MSFVVFTLPILSPVLPVGSEGAAAWRWAAAGVEARQTLQGSGEKRQRRTAAEGPSAARRVRRPSLPARPGPGRRRAPPRAALLIRDWSLPSALAPDWAARALLAAGLAAAEAAGGRRWQERAG